MRVLLLALLAACQYNAPTSDPSIDPNPDPTVDSSVGGDDSGAASCVEGVRDCIDGTHSAVCQNGQFVADRACPPSSACASGRCSPPTGALACTGDVGCINNDVCDVYVVGGMLQGFCTAKLGNTANSCSTVGYDATCDSGICASGGDTRCLSPCLSGADCVGGSQECVGVSAPITIEGQSTAALKHCVPD